MALPFHSVRLNILFLGSLDCARHSYFAQKKKNNNSDGGVLADFLGRTEVRVSEVQEEARIKKGPITKRLILHEVETGEVVVKLDLQLYDWPLDLAPGNQNGVGVILRQRQQSSNLGLHTLDVSPAQSLSLLLSSAHTRETDCYPACAPRVLVEGMLLPWVMLSL